MTKIGPKISLAHFEAKQIDRTILILYNLSLPVRYG
jgi:hypothetical protein